MTTNTEDSDVFDLEGEHYFFEGQGARTGSEEETEEFPLSKGLLIWECGHEGSGDFFVTLWNDPYFRPCGLARGSGEGLYEGALRVGPYEGSFWDIFFDDDLGPPEPDKSNLLKVEASGPWFCHLLQPALGQLSPAFPYRSSGDADGVIAGFFKVGPRPLLLNAQHNGGGEFSVGLISFDGTHVCEVVEEDGQCQLEQCQIEAKTGKEYLLLVQATGTWNLEFTEGY